MKVSAGDVYSKAVPLTTQRDATSLCGMSFVSCPACACPAKTHELDCPSCGVRLRGADGSIARTAIAALLGISAATGLAACSASAPKYGVPATELTAPTGETSPSTSSSALPPPAPEYGVPATEQGPEVRPLYGIPATPDKSNLPPG